MKHRIITVSREFAAADARSPRKWRKKLRIPCYDQELIEKVAEESGFAKEFTSPNTANRRATGSTNAFAAAASYYGPSQGLRMDGAEEGHS